MDLSQVKVSKKQALPILAECRKRLVENLLNGICRKDAFAEVAEWLKGQDNILSPYASDVVSAIIVTDEEIEFRRKYGNAFTEAYIIVKNAMSEKHS